MPPSNQQMLTPLSQQSIGHQQPMSNAPATPATPQQILLGHSCKFFKKKIAKIFFIKKIYFKRIYLLVLTKSTNHNKKIFLLKNIFLILYVLSNYFL